MNKELVEKLTNFLNEHIKENEIISQDLNFDVAQFLLEYIPVFTGYLPVAILEYEQLNLNKGLMSAKLKLLPTPEKTPLLFLDKGIPDVKRDDT